MVPYSAGEMEPVPPGPLGTPWPVLGQWTVSQEEQVTRVDMILWNQSVSETVTGAIHTGLVAESEQFSTGANQPTQSSFRKNLIPTSRPGNSYLQP